MEYIVSFNNQSIILNFDGNKYLAPKNEARMKVFTERGQRCAQLLVQSWPNDIKFYVGGESTINGLTDPDLIVDNFYNGVPAPLTTTTTLQISQNNITVFEKGQYAFTVIEGFIKLHSHSLGDEFPVISEAVF